VQRRHHDFVAENDADDILVLNDEENDADNTTNWGDLTMQIEEELANLGGKRDKSAVSREESLTRIIKCLKHSFVPDFIYTQKSEFVRVMNQGLSSRSPEEQILSCSVLGLLCIISGNSWKSLYEQFTPVLMQYIQKSDNFDLRSACLETLCITCYVWVDEEAQTDICLKLLQNIIINNEDIPINKDTSGYFQSSLDMWCLMVTLIDDNAIVDELLPNDIGGIINLLMCPDINIRLAAGEALAFLCNVVSKTEEENEKVLYDPLTLLHKNHPKKELWFV